MNIPEFKFCLVDGADETFLPTRGEPFATGWDVRALNDITIKPFEKVMIPLGIKAFIPDNYWLELRPRSSSFAKKNLHSLYGVVDNMYENRIFFCCRYIPDIDYDCIFLNNCLKDFSGNPVKNLEIKRGDAIGQLIPVRRQEMKVENISSECFDELCKVRNGSRKLGGFGSTDKK